MYKQQNTPGLEKSGYIIQWIKRKILLILTACMLGMSNAMHDKSKMITGNQHYTEQEQKKE